MLGRLGSSSLDTASSQPANGADAAQQAAELAMLLNSGADQLQGGHFHSALTSTDAFLTTDLASLQLTDSLQADEIRSTFLDSAQEICESAYSSHLSSCSEVVHPPSSGLPPGQQHDYGDGSSQGIGDGGETVHRSYSGHGSADRRAEGGSSGPRSALGQQQGGAGQPRRSQLRGQGYRKLWQQVTKVSKGQRLQDAVGLGFSDMTVEDLLRIVMKLAPSESAVEAVKGGLVYLDSSATAALLKELSKQGCLKRAVEIFDWLRSLDPGHELACLCDLYTYTTMISQCGSHQQLRRALELVAEMRSKGVTCNVHTYSALMNVCIKANELDLAIDVYKQMLEEGCQPNVVTYNILIDVFVRRCQWEEAVRVLDTLEKQGIQAEVRTYNTVITACNKSGKPDEALKVYEKMLATGTKPSATTYTALISAYGKRGQVEKALDIFNDMIRRGCERNVITYSSLISACEKAGRWEMAMELFNKMHKEGCKPNVVTYNSLIAACSHGGHWEKASEFFEQMQAQGFKPDAITFNGLISALERGGQWRRALKAFEQMQAHGCHPDAAVFNSLMEVLWGSGVLLAQAKALQLWTIANRNGHFRIYTNGKQDVSVLQYSTVAFTAGAAVVTIIRWVAELKAKLAKDGPAFLKDKVSFMVHKSKTHRSEQPSSRILEAISALLQGNGAPFGLQLFDQTITLEAASPALAAWLRSPAFLDYIHIQQSQAQKRVALDVMLSEDVAIAARCIEAFNAVKRFEQLYTLNPALCHQALLAQRPQIVHLILKYGAAFSFKEDTVYDGLQLFDRVACSGVPLNVSAWPLMLCSCVLLAARQVEPAGVWPQLEQVTLMTGFASDSLAVMDRTVLAALHGDLSTISPLRVIQLYLERLGHYLPDFKGLDRVTKDIQGLMVKVACSPVLGLRPSVVAASALMVVRRSKGMVPIWPMVLQSMTGYPEEQPELTACTMHLEGLMLAPQPL